MTRQVNVPMASVNARVVVPGDPEQAFEKFTAKFGQWWPLDSHSVFTKDSAGVSFELRKGGRIVEQSKGGREAQWGRVQDFKPGEFLKFTWHPGRGEETAQDITVKFTSMMFGTTLELEHGNWEPLGDQAKKIRGSYELQWAAVLQKLADFRA